jgi:hypothetical protein
MRLHYGSTQGDLTVAMVLVGLGLGALLQTYMLVVQNATTREELGVATSITQLSRSMGATVGTAVFGTVMTGGLAREIPEHLPAGAAEGADAQSLSGGSGAGAVLDPGTFADLPPAAVDGIREALAASLYPVFVAGVPVIAAAFVASLFIKELPLRKVAYADERPSE